MASNPEIMISMITALLEPQRTSEEQVALFMELRKDLRNPISATTMDLEWGLLILVLLDLIAAQDNMDPGEAWSRVAHSIHLESGQELSQISTFSDIEIMGQMIAENYLALLDADEDEW